MRSCLCCVILLLMISVCEGCMKEEKRALLQIRESLNKPNGSALRHWVGDDCCTWTGVACDESSPPRVYQITFRGTRKEEQGGWYPNATLFAQFKSLQKIDLSGTQFRGWVMPQGLNQLSSLQILRMKNNQFNDQSITPWINNLTSLTTIDLSNNELETASFLSGLQGIQDLDLSSNKLIDSDVALWIYNLTSLTRIVLSNNMLREAPWIYNSTYLTYVDLSRNQLHDNSIITGICRMQSLEQLDLRENQIQGSIPQCLGNLTSIKHLYLSKNQFSGEMPFSLLANLSQLAVLALSSNYKLQVETESSSWFPSFQLRYLYLGNCILNKRSGGRIPSFLSSQQFLNRLDLSNSSLMGDIPAFLIYNISLDALTLQSNELVGPFPIPHRNATSSLRFLDISNNSLSKSLFRDIGNHFPNLERFNVSANKLQGAIPSLGKTATLKVLDLSYNNFSGEIPDMLTRNSSLMFLILSNNKLRGELLPNSSNMSQLALLDLRNNLFTGTMPKDLLNSPQLKLLDVNNNSLAGALPSWLSDLKELVALFLGRNTFRGSIPVEICRLQNLHVLDLSHNILSGIIPHCLNTLTSLKKVSPVQLRIPGEAIHTFERSFASFEFTTKGLSRSYKGIPLSLMTGIDLSANHLSGNIPSEIGDLVELRSLNLSYNLLTGLFPPPFQKLINLESLDLSHNKLVGVIPPGMGELSSLSVFNVAYNNLSGCIPITTQFTTFNATSYEGNPLLERNCSDVDNPHSTTEEEEEEDVRIIDRPWVFRLLIGISYAIGVWVVVVTLIFSNKWRKAFLDTIDSHLDAFVRRIMAYYQSRS